MDTQSLNPLLEYGLPGIVIFALFAIIFSILKMSSQERKEWRDTFISISQMADTRQAETNQVIREMTAVIERNGNKRRG